VSSHSENSHSSCDSQDIAIYEKKTRRIITRKKTLKPGDIEGEEGTVDGDGDEYPELDEIHRSPLHTVESTDQLDYHPEDDLSETESEMDYRLRQENALLEMTNRREYADHLVVITGLPKLKNPHNNHNTNHNNTTTANNTNTNSMSHHPQHQV